jgi:iron complex outermembrane receptor protein
MRQHAKFMGTLGGVGSFTLIAVTAAVITPLRAQAADSPPPEPTASTPPGPAATNDLEEILVTAQRRSEAKFTTPVSISAFSSETLASQGITNTAELQSLTPGVILNGSGNLDNTTFTIRGQGKAVIGPGLPSVITYLNEVPLPSWGSSPPVFDMDNVQILKGPQGTAFGRNTTGGAVLVYSAQPTYDFGGYGQAQVGDYGDAEFQGAVNLPVVADKLAVRIAGNIERRDGYTNNVATGQKLDDKHNEAVRVSVLAQPTERLKNVLVLDYSRSSTHGVGIIPFEDLDPAALGPTLAALGPASNRTVSTSNVPYERSTYWGVSNTTTADFDFLTVKNIFGYRNNNIQQAHDGTGLPVAPLPDLGAPANFLVTPGAPGIYFNSQNGLRNDQFSDELQFSGTALQDHLTWLTGFFYLHGRPTGPDFIALDNFHPTVPTATDTFLANSVYHGAWPVSALEDNLYTDESRSGFVTLSYDLAQLSPVLQGLKLDGGFRYTWDRESVCANSRPVISLADSSLLAPPYQSVSDCTADPTSYNASARFKAPTHQVGLDYALNENAFFYFTTRSGYRAGGINTPLMAPVLSAFQNYQPQKVTDYEIGFHGKWQAGEWRGRFNIDTYRDNYSALQLEAIGIQTGTVVGGVPITAINQPSNTALTLNAGTATFQGVDFDGSISPFHALNISYGAAYLSAKYDTLTAPDIIQPFFSPGHFSGAPHWSYQAAVHYELPFHPSPGGEFSVNGNYYHIGAEYQDFVRVPAYGLTDFTVQWSSIAGQPLDLTLFVDNAFNTFYLQNIGIGALGAGVFSGNYGAPRMYGARVRYTLGH